MLIGLDLNATRARAVCGPTAQAAAPLSLEGADFELPVAVSLEERVPAVGHAGAALCRRQPDLACLDFLAQLGTGRVWSAGRLRIDAAGALALVFDCQQYCLEHLVTRLYDLGPEHADAVAAH